jgi:hypothetical protein
MTRRCAVLAGFLLTSSTFPDVDPGRSYERLWKTAQEVARTHLTVTAIEDAARQVIEGSCDTDPVVVIVTPGGNSKSRCGPMPGTCGPIGQRIIDDIRSGLGP